MAYLGVLRTSRVIAFAALAAPLVLAFAACSADGAGDPLLETTGGSVEPEPTATLPPSTDASPPSSDASADAGKDASKDAKAEASVDAGKPAPLPGAACTTLDEIFTRACGACGKQQALCLAKPDGKPGVVSEYSQCEGELAGGCVPGTVENEACGNCGTRKRTCSTYCAWTTGACTGEPPSSCTPTSYDYTTAGCTTAGTFRTRACGSACTWSSFSATCEALDFQLVVGANVGDSVSAIYPLRASKVDKRLSGTCPSGYFSTTTTHPYFYVELINPTAQTLTLSAWNTVANPTATIIDTIMGWYEGSEPPPSGDDNARKACKKGMVDSCPTGLPCGDYKWAGLTGTNAITIPAGGSATVYVGAYYPTGSSSPSEGPVKLVVRTDTAM